MASIPAEQRLAQAKKASLAATAALKLRPPSAHILKWGAAYKDTMKSMAGAKQRCTSENPGDAYENYKKRGVEFKFPSSKDAALWVLENLGPRPSKQHSIDRIDNEAHYEMGNLRWATRAEQAQNKRMYKVNAYGARVRQLHAMRPDVSRQTIYGWIAKGLSDDIILDRGKYERSSSSI